MIKQKILSKVAAFLILLAFLTASACRTCNCPAYSQDHTPRLTTPALQEGVNPADVKPASPEYHTIIL